MEPKEWLREFRRLQSDVQKHAQSAERIGPTERKEFLRRFAQLKDALPVAAEWGPVLPGDSGQLTQALILGLDGHTQYKGKRRGLMELKEVFIELSEQRPRRAGRPLGKLALDTPKRILRAAAALKLGYQQSQMLPLLYRGYKRPKDREAGRQAVQKFLKRHATAIDRQALSMSQEVAKKIVDSSI